MKKEVWLIVLGILITGNLSAQNFDEWWRQKQTKKRYLLEQIAALKVYTNTAWKCYETARAGLGVIGETKEGDFNIHSEHFGKLRKISPTVASYSRLAEIIKLQAGLVSLRSRNSGMDMEFLDNREREFAMRFFTRTITESVVNLSLLTSLLTDSTVEMTDRERLDRIEGIYAEMLETYSFALILDQDLRGLSGERRKEQDEIKRMEENYGIVER
ncbi:hypothetical protein SAMN00777080_3542 [Aquiflexum balticum DSM 16537]|uniref:Uncharacterized protein n=1 Tax=Aquiflexum balticum DSM 16537 TaxID=758820 RepID=A0A1W2H7L6_9BACT|nr:hypothetical protein [Aquiflexum balticum]SMD44905.1 hypothetical protein SAMN00777080_3542 [Aquiflexum balticum DSM 16537]